MIGAALADDAHVSAAVDDSHAEEYVLEDFRPFLGLFRVAVVRFFESVGARYKAMFDKFFQRPIFMTIENEIREFYVKKRLTSFHPIDYMNDAFVCYRILCERSFIFELFPLADPSLLFYG